MKKRIFWSIWIVALGVFAVSTVVLLCVLYHYFLGVQRSQLRIQAELAAQGVEGQGAAYFDGLFIQDYRITWIDHSGTVLYDSRSGSAPLENHLQREEIRQAFANGSGESTRYSSTLLERYLYYAKRLPDGTVLRLSTAHSTRIMLLLGMLWPICLIVVAALAVSLFLAYRLSRAVVRPLNELNLDDPLHSGGYAELSPFLHRIANQQRQICAQQQELLQKQKEWEAVTTGMTEGIVLLNGKKRILSINPAAMRFFGTGPDCVGHDLLSVNRSLALQELLQGAGEGAHTERVLGWDSRTYQLDASPLVSDGMVTGIALLILDVTEKEQAEQVRREFTANVSHELKTPLHTISGSAELLMNGMVKPEDIARFSGQIYTQAQRMICLVEDIIKLSHLDEGAGTMMWETLDLYALAAQTVQTLLPKADEAGVTLTLCGEGVQVHGIRQLIEAILFNLCDNAVKYNRPSGSVVVRVGEQEGQACLSVSDTGIGIPAEHQERIFERFYRVDKSHSKEIGGTGLGLSIVKHAAKLHHAAVSVESRPGQGTVVTVVFPG